MSDKTINSADDISVSDIFDINPYEYFVVTEIVDGTVNGIIRDGIYTVGDQYKAEFALDEVISKVEEVEWEYKGEFSYMGEDINGDPIE